MFLILENSHQMHQLWAIPFTMHHKSKEVLYFGKNRTKQWSGNYFPGQHFGGTRLEEFPPYCQMTPFKINNVSFGIVILNYLVKQSPSRVKTFSPRKLIFSAGRLLTTISAICDACEWTKLQKPLAMSSGIAQQLVKYGKNRVWMRYNKTSHLQEFMDLLWYLKYNQQMDEDGLALVIITIARGIWQ